MIQKNRKVIYILLLSIILLLVGCGKTQFDNDYKTFKDSYLKIADVLDSKEPFKSIDNLNRDNILEELDYMKSIVLNMENEASSEREKKICSNVKRYYEGLKFLQYAANNKENLSEDERGRIATELTLMEINKSSIEKGEE